MFAFLYIKANSKEICEEISFPSFFRKMLMSVFLLRFRANSLEKNAWLPLFFTVDSNSPFKDLRFPCGPNLAQKPLYLLGTVLKRHHCRGTAFIVIFTLEAAVLIIGNVFLIFVFKTQSELHQKRAYVYSPSELMFISAWL